MLLSLVPIKAANTLFIHNCDKNHSAVTRPTRPKILNVPLTFIVMYFPFNICHKKLSESDRTPCTQALALCKSSGDQNIPQPKPSANQNIPQHQEATFEVDKSFMEAIVFMKTMWPIVSHDKYLMVDEPSNRAIEAQNCWRVFAGAPVVGPSVCQLLGSWSFKIDPQTREAVSFGFCLMLLYHIWNIDYASKYTLSKLNISTIPERLPDGAHWTNVRTFTFGLYSETERWIQVGELLVNDVYLSTVVDDQNSRFIQMEVVGLIEIHIFFTANSSVCQPKTFLYFQSLTP